MLFIIVKLLLSLFLKAFIRFFFFCLLKFCLILQYHYIARMYLEIWDLKCSVRCYSTVMLDWSLMHFRMVTHAQAQVQMMCIVVLLRLNMTIMVITGAIIIILLCLLPLRVFLVFHSAILEPDFHLSLIQLQASGHFDTVWAC